MASEPNDYTIFICTILTSNTEATDNVQFLNLAYRVKGFQCHSNNSLQLLGRKKTTTKQYTLFKSFLCDIFQLSSGCNTQCFDTTGHAPTQTFAVVQWTMYFQVNTVAHGL